MTKKELQNLDVSAGAKLLAKFFTERKMLQEFLDQAPEADAECGLAYDKLCKYRTELRTALGYNENSPPADTGRVYIFQSETRYKIGYSRDVRGRFFSMRGKFPNLKCVFVMCGNRELEAILHTRYKDLAEGGEWFRLEAYHLEEIRDLCDDILIRDGTNFHESVSMALDGP